MKAYSYKSVESILKNNLDGKELPVRLTGPSVTHENIRGNTYYSMKGETYAARTDF